MSDLDDDWSTDDWSTSVIPLEETPPTLEEYLVTLRKLPDDVVKALVEVERRDEFDMGSPSKCLVAYAARELRQRYPQLMPESTLFVEAEEIAALMTDSPVKEWSQIFWDVCDEDRLSTVMSAFHKRVEEIVPADA